MQRLGDERLGRRGRQGAPTGHLIGRFGDEPAVEAQHLRGAGKRVQQHPAEHYRADGVQRELKRCDDAEVPAAAAQPPEQLGVISRAGRQEGPVGGDHVGGQQVVTSAPGGAFQPAAATAEGEPGDARGRVPAAGHRQPERLGLAVQLGPGEPGLGARHPPRRVDLHSLHRPQVNHQPALAHRVTGEAVPAPVHRDQQAPRASVIHRSDHVGHPRAAGNQGRLAVEQPVEHPPGLVIPGTVRAQDLTAEPLLKRPVHVVDQQLPHRFLLQIVCSPRLRAAPAGPVSRRIGISAGSTRILRWSWAGWCPSTPRVG